MEFIVISPPPDLNCWLRTSQWLQEHFVVGWCDAG